MSTVNVIFKKNGKNVKPEAVNEIALKFNFIEYLLLLKYIKVITSKRVSIRYNKPIHARTHFNQKLINFSNVNINTELNINGRRKIA